MTVVDVSGSRFAGKVAVVSGSSQGLGAAVARLMAREGADGLVVTGRDDERGEAVAADLRALGADGRFIVSDLAEPAGPDAVIAFADAAFGRIDVLVNCAAITDRDTIWDSTPEFFDRMVAINTRAPLFLMQGAAQLMRREGIEGTMVNVGSISAYGGQPFIMSYCAAKGALATLTRNVANALLPERIRVNAINPGWMATEGEDRIQRGYHGAGDDWLDEAGRSQPFGRILDPGEVARAIAFLASSDSGLMTGTVMDFDQHVVGAWD
jgi:NAD(P)-dependent dehydrogenase (short-subunit alcohol dehydrogenase family)